MTQALWAFGGAVGSILGGLLGSRLGRKNTLLLNNIFLMTGILLQVRTVTSLKSSINLYHILKFVTFQTNNFSYNWILVGRFLNGIGCGIGMTISPIYLTELSPINLRGAFGTSYSLL